MVPKRAVFIALALVAAAGVASAVWLAHRAETEEEAFIREWPEALVYKGIYLYADSNLQGAVDAWQQYLRIAPPGADTTGLGALIEEARRKGGGSVASPP